MASGVAGLLALALTVANALTEYVSSVKDKAQNVQELRDEIGLLGEALSLLNDFIVEEELKGRRIEDTSVFAKAIRDCKARIERIGDSLKPTEGNKMKRAWDRFVWPFEERVVLKMVADLRRFTEIFNFAANTQGFRMVSKAAEQTMLLIHESLAKLNTLREDNIKRALAVESVSQRIQRLEALLTVIPLLESTAFEIINISDGVRLAEEEARKARKSRILDWICPREALHRHIDIQAHRTAGTGEGFLQHPEVLTWLDDTKASRDLLCVGAPGSGKSYLSSIVIDHLTQSVVPTTSVTAFYYCDYKEKQLQTVTYFVSVILRQLCHAQTSLPKAVGEFYEKYRDALRDLSWFQTALTLTSDLIATSSIVRIVIDALDEIESDHLREQIYDILHQFRQTSDNVRIFATARPLISRAEEKLTDCAIVKVSASQQDLKLHLNNLLSVRQSANLIIDDDLKQAIVLQLCENAGGLFLLPSLQINSILNHVTKAKVKRALAEIAATESASPAKKLEDAYASTIQRIQDLPSEQREVALETLTWVAYAKRPLKTDELQYALAVSLNDAGMDAEDLIPVSTIMSTCCGLVEVERNSRNVQFPHFSLNEYFLNGNHKLFKDADLKICRSLLQYLSLDFVPQLAGMNQKQFYKALRTYPLLDYACVQWGFHAQTVPVSAIEDLLLPILYNVPRLLVMARVRDQESPFRRKYGERMQMWAISGGAGISLAAAFGLTDLIKLLISRTPAPKLNAKNMYGSTPLHEAAMFGYLETVNVLLAAGASLFEMNLSGSLPIHLAVENRQLQVAEVLLQSPSTVQAQFEARRRGGFTCFHQAVDQDDERMVALLLKKGASVNVVDGSSATPLHLAALHDFLGLCRLLVDSGANIHAGNSQWETPLDLAASAGHASVIQFLVESGADIEHTSWNKWTPLHRSVRAGRIGAVSYLLQQNASLTAKDKKGYLPLHLATRSGNLDVVSLVLNARKDQRKYQLHQPDKNGATPRETAFFCSHYLIHKFLRRAEREYDPAPASMKASDEITEAIERGDIDQVRGLIQAHPALIDSPDDDGQPPLHVAIQEDRLDIATFLLESGASIESTGYHGWRPIHIASSLGKPHLVQFCLSHNASLLTLTSSHQTPIHKACSAHNVDVVRMLVEAGADPHARNDRGMTGLHVAAHQGDLAIGRYLVLEVGLSVRSKDRYGWEPWRWATRSGWLEVKAFIQERKDAERELARAEKDNAIAEGGGKKVRIMGLTRPMDSGDELSRDVDNMDEEEEDFDILEDAREGLEEMFI